MKKFNSIQLSLFDSNTYSFFLDKPCSLCHTREHVLSAVFKLPGENIFKDLPICINCIHHPAIIRR